MSKQCHLPFSPKLLTDNAFPTVVLKSSLATSNADFEGTTSRLLQLMSQCLKQASSLLMVGYWSHSLFFYLLKTFFTSGLIDPEIIPFYIVGPMGENCTHYLQISTEWLDESWDVSFADALAKLLRYYPDLSNIEFLKSFKEPCIVWLTDQTLRSHDSFTLLHHWRKNKSKAIFFLGKLFSEF